MCVERDSIRLLLTLSVFLSWATAGAAALGHAGESWVKKSYLKWTEAEALEVLTDSPWAKLWFTSLGPSPSVPPKDATSGEPVSTGQHENCCRTFGTGVGAGAADPRNTPSGAPLATDSGGAAGSTPQVISYRVVWISSMRVRQALWRLRQLHGEGTDPAAQASLSQPAGEIVIALTGLAMARFNQITLADLKGSTYLQSKKNKGKRLELIAFTPPARRPDRLAVFVFSRTHEGRPALEANDREMEFCTGEGRMRVSVPFKLSKMVTDGVLDY